MSQEDELREHVMKRKGTEPPFSGKYLAEKRPGVYKCAGCGHELFNSDAKFDSGCGWPSFDRPADDSAVTTKPDLSHMTVRTEVICPECGGHLGHVFNDGPTDTGKRYCINSISLNLNIE